MNKKLFAFTLAEVLITLTIIGVIAAITIPNLMQGYRKHQVETSLKSTYTILSNALTMAQADYGSMQELVEACNNGTSAEKANCFSNKYLKPYLKYARSCECGEAGCKQVFPVNMMKILDGTPKNWERLSPNHYMATIGLNNGILVGVMWFDTDVAPEILVDVNGWNGPNQMGTDAFYFTLKHHIGGSGDIVPSGLRCGTSYTDPVVYKNNNYCNDLTFGYQCSCSIMYNGWKIPDNYPVKKW